MVLGRAHAPLGAGLACTDVPLCQGKPVAAACTRTCLHVVHRLFALVVLGSSASSIVPRHGAARGQGAGGRGAAARVVQITLGILSVTTFLDAAGEAHLGVAAAMLADCRSCSCARPRATPRRAPAGGSRWLARSGRARQAAHHDDGDHDPPAALWLAPGRSRLARAIMTLIGIALLVAAANAFNMVLERDVDALMRRTRNRPLPAGRLTPEMALAFGIALACAALPLVRAGANLCTGLLASSSLVLYVFVYTPLKRRSPWALVVGAVPGAIPPLMGWTASTGHIGAPGLPSSRCSSSGRSRTSSRSRSSAPRSTRARGSRSTSSCAASIGGALAHRRLVASCSSRRRSCSSRSASAGRFYKARRRCSARCCWAVRLRALPSRRQTRAGRAGSSSTRSSTCRSCSRRWLTDGR